MKRLGKMNCILLGYVVFLSLEFPDTEQTKLSILAPEIICPKSSNNTFGRPDYSMVRILSKTYTDMSVKWSVSWNALTRETQRLTIMIWKSVRDLEKKLNGPQVEPLLSVIINDELIPGVNYILNVTANMSGEIITKSFSLKYYKYNQVSRGATELTDEAFSMMLLGGRWTYADINFAIEAEVTTCSSTQNYYFAWEVFSESLDHTVNVSDIIGSRLELPRYTLMPGNYEVNCQLKNGSDDVLMKEVSARIHVRSRGLDVFLSFDRLIVSRNTAFIIESLVESHDYEDYSVEYEWKCFNKREPYESCDFIEISNGSSFNFSSGIPNAGEFLITLTAVVAKESSNTNATVVVAEPRMPIIQIDPVSRLINEGSSILLLGQVSRAAPSCSLTWYFAAEEFLNTTESLGAAISDTHTIFSLEENFLSELVDFSNDTESAEIEVHITSPGRARLVAECNCTSSSSGESINVPVTYADVHFQLNESPKVDALMVSPEMGSALETMFQIRSRAKDSDRPLRYSFYCAIGPNVTLLLGSYLEYDMVETFLPSIDGEMAIWVEVCDALGACSKSETSSIQMRSSSGKTFDSLIEHARAFIRRCEITRLMHVAISAVISYTSAGQSELAGIFTIALFESLPALHSGCSLPQYRYAAILDQLAAAGLDITPLLS